MSLYHMMGFFLFLFLVVSGVLVFLYLRAQKDHKEETKYYRTTIETQTRQFTNTVTNTHAALSDMSNALEKNNLIVTAFLQSHLINAKNPTEGE